RPRVEARVAEDARTALERELARRGSQLDRVAVVAHDRLRARAEAGDADAASVLVDERDLAEDLLHDLPEPDALAVVGRRQQAAADRKSRVRFLDQLAAQQRFAGPRKR